MDQAALSGLQESSALALARIASDSGAELVARDAHALAARIRDGLFYVACVGQMKRGKSTLLNALIQDPVLPTGIVPVTTVLTILRHGAECAARVRFADGACHDVDRVKLGEYISEQGNPANEKGVAVVEVFSPSPLLASGMCLVDTPGIGSVFGSNTQTTRAFVPHVDAALVVLGADPPVSADELALVGEIATQCPDILFVLSKADKISGSDLQEAVAFTRRVLSQRLGKDTIPVYEISGTERLAGEGPVRSWPEFTRDLEALAQDSGSDLVRAAEARELAILSSRLRHHLAEERRALLRPVEESERRIQALRACVAEAERSLNDLAALFTAEHERLRRSFTERREQFLTCARPAAYRELDAAIRAAVPQRRWAERTAAIERADEIARRWLDRWLAEAQPAAESLYLEAIQRFVELANNFLARFAGSDDPALASLPQAVSPETGFRVRSRLYYTSMMTLTSRAPLDWILDLLRSRKQRIKAVERQAGEYLDRLLVVNANRIANDFDDRVLESRRHLQSEIRAALAGVAATAVRALGRAKQQRAQGTQAVHAEVERIHALTLRLESLVPSRKEPAS